MSSDDSIIKINGAKIDVKSIHDLWNDYETEAIPKTATEKERHHERLAFYAGMQVMQQLMNEVCNPALDDETVEHIVADIHQDTLDYFEGEFLTARNLAMLKFAQMPEGGKLN